MKISIIIPMWNAAPFIEDCLKSIAAQTYSDFECICIDDGSPDNCGQLVEEFAKQDNRFQVISQQNGGISVARDTGLKHATGELILFVDADDYIHPETLELLLNTMQEENADVVGCDFVKTSKTYHETITSTIKNPKKIVFNDPLMDFMKKRDVKTSAWGKLYKKSLLDKLAVARVTYFEDVPWTVNVMMNIKKYVFVKVPLYYYYNNMDSIIRVQWSSEKTDSYIKVIQIVYKDISENKPELLADAVQYICNQRIKMVFNRIKKTPKDVQKQLWAHATPLIQELYASKHISYAGLKLKHRWTLWRVLHAK